MGELKTNVMYILSYLISIFNFFIGLILFLLVVIYFIFFKGADLSMDGSILYGMNIYDKYTMESSKKKFEEIEIKQIEIIEFTSTNNYNFQIESGELIIIVPDYQNVNSQGFISPYDGNHQSDAILKLYYDENLEKIVEFSNIIGNIRINVATENGETLGKCYNGMYVEETNRELPFIVEDSE